MRSRTTSAPNGRPQLLRRVKAVEEAQLLATRIAELVGFPDAAVAVEELLVNGIEHGNLGIGYDEKTRLLEEGELEAERQRRLALPHNKDKRVTVELFRNDTRWEVAIRDCGEGFAFDRYREIDEQRLLDRHGRGVVMACSIAEVEYLPPGNRVVLRVPRSEVEGQPC